MKLLAFMVMGSVLCCSRFIHGATPATLRIVGKKLSMDTTTFKTKLLHEERNLFKVQSYALEENEEFTTSQDKFSLEGIKRRWRTKRNTIHRMSSWRSWSRCSSSTCGVIGFQRRRRQCIGRSLEKNCLEAVTEIRRCLRRCNNVVVRDTTRWQNWGMWSSCSASCGPGRQHRDRKCLRQDRIPCSSHTREERMCLSNKTCPSWSNWKNWSSCSKSCGTGTRSRVKECIIRLRDIGIPAYGDDNVLKITATVSFGQGQEVVASSLCSGRIPRETEKCTFANSCGMFWATWQPWSKCGKTCGSGMTYRTRRCIKATGISFGCPGSSVDYRKCYTPPCWSEWSQFGSCSVNCGSQIGYRSKTRECLHTTSFIHVYSRCQGHRNMYEACTPTQPCPTWNAWSEYSSCSKSCNWGFRTRTRNCTAEPCFGKSIERKSCNFQACPVWSIWTSFSCCSVTCGFGGVKRRTRYCRNGSPGIRGCDGSAEDVRQCSSSSCNATNQHVLDGLQCGVRSKLVNARQPASSVKIIGGQKSKWLGWPWHGSWQHYDCRGTCSWKHLCGSTLIAPSWVVTAGHCTNSTRFVINRDNPGDEWSVLMDMNRASYIGTRYYLSRVFLHDSYSNINAPVADIALAKLRWPADPTPSVSPICLSGFNKPRPGDLCYVTGWDSNAKGGRQLMEAQVPVLGFETCRKLGGNYKRHLLKKHHFCAGDPVTASVDTCKGDSGGSLSCRKPNGGWYLAGVTSFGFGYCGTPGHVGVYALVSTYESWMRQIVAKFNGCA